MRVLVVEDNPDLADLLKRGLEEEGYAVDLSRDGEDGLWRATTVDYDAVVLDLMLPKVEGLEILRRMRRAGRTSPVLILTARDATDDRVRGLDLGADDYLVKPFEWEELLARLRALVRRGAGATDGVLELGALCLDPARRRVALRDAPVDLTAKEFQILHVLLREPGRVFTRTEIGERIYDDDHDGVSNTIDVLLSRLRKKLGTGERVPVIRTVRGVGYVLEGGDHA
jgi:two-component system OmpR family response regulator